MSDTDMVVSVRYLENNIRLMTEFADNALEEMRRWADKGNAEMAEWYRGRSDGYRMAADFCQQDIDVFAHSEEL
jgi:hypothetical protein